MRDIYYLSFLFLHVFLVEFEIRAVESRIRKNCSPSITELFEFIYYLNIFAESKILKLFSKITYIIFHIIYD